MKTMNARRIGLAAGLLGFALAVPIAAQSIPAMDRGWYSSTDFHDPTVTNYLVGNCTTCTYLYYNNWFVFDLSNVDAVITGASLALWNPNNFVSPDSTEIYELYDVSTPIDDLINATGGTGVYTDLGSGTSYGSYELTPIDSGAQVVIPLNAAGLAALNAGLGGRVAVGGAITTLNGAPGTYEGLFGGTGTYNGAVHLILETGAQTVDSVDQGWWREDGFHVPTNENYLAGNISPYAFNNWFAFDLSGTSGLVTSATLALENPWGLVSSDSTESYEIHGVSTPVADVIGGLGGVATYDDLGSGLSFGSYLFTSADEAPIGVVGTVPLAEITLNGAGLAALNAAMGGQFAIGGTLTSLDSNPSTSEHVLGSTGGVSPKVIQLVLEIEEAWMDLGGGTAGSLGQPLLTATGSLVGGTPTTMALSNAPPGAAMVAWISFMPTPFAALGGTVHAFPFANQLFLFADGSGSFSAAVNWPVGVPAGSMVWFQFLVQDGSSIHGITLSNALKATTP